MEGFAIVNESSHPELTFPLLVDSATELAYQQEELADWYDLRAMPVSAAASLAAVPKRPGLCVVRFVDTLNDPNALAYHYTDQHGRPCADIGVDIILANGGTLTGPDSLLTAASHELCEARLDPYCTWFALMPGGKLTTLEVCDWTQADSYERNPGSGLFVSNFVGPRAFNLSATDGPWDRMGLMSGPFQLRPGGYWTTYDGGSWGTVFGDEFPAWKRAAKLSAGSRGMFRRRQ